MKVVLDTNVLVSRILVPKCIPARIFQHWEEEAFELLVSEPILEECLRVLSYRRIQQRHRLTAAEKAEYIDNLRSFATPVNPDLKIEAVGGDPDDNKILACAVAGNADYIVTGDAHLLHLGEYNGIPILPPAAFLLLLEHNRG